MHLATQGIGDDGEDVAVLRAGSGKEPEMSIRDPEDGNLAGAGKPYRAKQRAVAAERYDEVGAIDIGFALQLER